MPAVATRIFPQGRQWCVSQYGTQVTAYHPTGKALVASARQQASKGQFPPFLAVCISFVPTTMCYATRKKTRYNVPCETALTELTTWGRDLREKISVLVQQASMECPRIRTEERPPTVANILNNQSRTSEKGWSP